MNPDGSFTSEVKAEAAKDAPVPAMPSVGGNGAPRPTPIGPEHLASVGQPAVRRRSRRAARPSDPLWYKTAIIYELHVRAFCDSRDDGAGDFVGLISKLDYLQDLGVTAIWLLPFYPSPLRDDGYDIADYLKVNPAYGTLQEVQKFIEEAHARGLRVITEMVINHTSDQHPWFQRARQAPVGSRHREFYVWSDTPDRYSATRIIFKDFETSNWAWDPVAKQYYWHRFYSHQPDLNFDNPDVHSALLRICDFWFDTGVDGMRLDAIPYLYEREGTNCENLPETHEFLRKLRSHVEKKYPDRMLLAEANQWPEDAIAYFGKGDECHMAFHFPLMPRLFMSIRMEDRFPIMNIFDQTPAIPERCQWALFLRNHDELTLEMVTDEERDYMYRVYAGDREARINLGIRRRLAPLLGNNRRKIELMNALLFSLPGTPVLYYGDEIGMGDNMYLGDRDGVRTPMQWSADRNAGFSRAQPQRLFLPVIIDPEYHYETVNVETQQANPSSLLWWMKRLITLRKRHAVFGTGSIEFLNPANAKVLAFLRTSPEERVLVVANLSRFVQPAHIDLPQARGAIPVEMFGQTPFPPVTEQPYFLTLGPHSFYWFLLQQPTASTGAAAPGPHIPTIVIDDDPERWLVSKSAWRSLAPAISADLQRRRWFVSKSRAFRQLRFFDAIPLKAGPVQTVRSASPGPQETARDSQPPSLNPSPIAPPPSKAAAGSTAPAHHVVILLAEVEFTDGEPDLYAVPVGLCTAAEAAEMQRTDPVEIIAHVNDGQGQEWVLFDAMTTADLPSLFLSAIARRRSSPGHQGELNPLRTRVFGSPAEAQSLPVRISHVEQSNSSVFLGDRFILKLFRRLEPGINPDLEISRHLTERVKFAHTPALAGAMEYRPTDQEPRTLAILQKFVPNQGDAWTYTLDQLGVFYDRVFALEEKRLALLQASLASSVLDAAGAAVPEPWAELMGQFLPSMELLGRRTAEMHAALADDHGDAAFKPEPFTQMYERSLAQSMYNTVRRTVQMLRQYMEKIDPPARGDAEEIIKRQTELLDVFRPLSSLSLSILRIRCHGDYHLGQVLWTGRDFVIIDFEGEPLNSVGERRLKSSPLRDVAGMLRSLQYAAATAMRRHADRGAIPPRTQDADRRPSAGVEPAVSSASSPATVDWARAWPIVAGGAFLRSYITTVRQIAPALLPPDRAALQVLLRAWMLKKALYEVSYELNSRPDWVGIPLRGVREFLTEPSTKESTRT